MAQSEAGFVEERRKQRGSQQRLPNNLDISAHVHFRNPWGNP